MCRFHRRTDAATRGVQRERLPLGERKGAFGLPKVLYMPGFVCEATEAIVAAEGRRAATKPACICVTLDKSNRTEATFIRRTMKRTISAMVGKGSVNHNSRKFKAANVDGERSHLNIDYCNENIKDVYHQLFDDALARYNAKQTRDDRRIENYYEKIRSGKQEKPFHELILQIGDKDNMGATTENGELAKQVLDEYFQHFQERNPSLRVFSAHLHMDEATPHLHIDFVPFTTGSKRGLDTRVSLKQALAALGFRGGTRGMTEWNQWVQSEKEQLAEVMLNHGIEWEQKGTHEKHLSVLDFEKKQRAEEVEQLNVEIESAKTDLRAVEKQLNQTVPKLKNAERLAADFPEDVDKLLPEAGALESAKTYREKKAKPVLEKAVRLVKSLYHSVLDLQAENRELRAKFDRKENSYVRVSEHNKKLLKENVELREDSKKLQKIRAAIGGDRVSEILSHPPHHQTL